MIDVIRLVVERGKAGMASGILPPISTELQLFCPLLEHLLPALLLREPEMAIKERCREGNSNNITSGRVLGTKRKGNLCKTMPKS